MQQSIVEIAKSYVTDQFNDPIWEPFTYHDINHTIDVVNAAKVLGTSERLSAEEMEVLIVAAWFHDIGYKESYDQHEEASMRIAQEFLSTQNYHSDKIEQVKELIKSTKTDYHGERDSILKQVIHDADHFSIGSVNFPEKSKLLRKEIEFKREAKLNGKEWRKIQKTYLAQTDFLTDQARENYAPIREENIKALKKKKKSKKKKKKKGIPETPKLGRGVETMYRVIFRNQINLSSIADNKANMLIGINAVMLSVLISLFGGNVLAQGAAITMDFRILIPVMILVLTSGIAMINATMAARPNIPKLKKYHETMSIFFFANFIQMPKDDFVQKMDDFKVDDNSIYTHLAEDIYDHGIVLNKKYLQLKVAYNVFMIGLLASLISLILLNIIF